MPVGELRNAAIAGFRYKSLEAMGPSHAHKPQYIRDENAPINGSAAATAEPRKRAHRARAGPGSYAAKLVTSAVGIFGCLNESGVELMNEIMMSGVGRLAEGELRGGETQTSTSYT